MKKKPWSHLERRMHTLALCTLNGTNCRFVSPSIWIFQWDWRSISVLEPESHAGKCARVTIWRTGCWCHNCNKSAMLSPNARAWKERIFSTAVRPKIGKKGVLDKYFNNKSVIHLTRGGCIFLCCHFFFPMPAHLNFVAHHHFCSLCFLRWHCFSLFVSHGGLC